MALLKYWDGTKYVEFGAKAAEEVAVQPDQPPATPDLWLDPDDTTFTGTDADALYLRASDGAMAGSLLLAAEPAQPAEAATKVYTDQLVTVSGSAAPAASPRDGVLWVYAALPPLDPPTVFSAVLDSLTQNTLSWIDSPNPDVATYEIYYNLTGFPVTDTDSAVALNVLPGTQTAIHIKDADAQFATTIYYGLIGRPTQQSIILRQVQSRSANPLSTDTLMVEASCEGVPSAPVLFNATYTSSTSDDLVWQAPVSPNSYTGYEIRYSLSSTIISDPLSGTLVGTYDASTTSLNVTKPDGEERYYVIAATRSDIPGLYGIWADNYADAPNSMLTTITLISASGSTATFECRDQNDAIFGNTTLNVRTFKPESNTNSSVSPISVGADGRAVLTHTGTECITYQPYTGSATGPWQGLPTSGGTITSGDGLDGMSGHFLVDCDGDIVDVVQNPYNAFTGTSTNLGIAMVGGQWDVYPITAWPTTNPIDQKSGAGTWSGTPASFWTGGGADINSTNSPVHIHTTNSTPVVGAAAPTTFMGTPPERYTGDPYPTNPLILPTSSFNPAAGQWIFAKNNTDGGWNPPPGGGYWISIACRFGYYNCTWSP